MNVKLPRNEYSWANKYKKIENENQISYKHCNFFQICTIKLFSQLTKMMSSLSEEAVAACPMGYILLLKKDESKYTIPVRVKTKTILHFAILIEVYDFCMRRRKK